jgi:hypothetical protein
MDAVWHLHVKRVNQFPFFGFPLTAPHRAGFAFQIKFRAAAMVIFPPFAGELLFESATPLRKQDTEHEGGGHSAADHSGS